MNLVKQINTSMCITEMFSHFYPQQNRKRIEYRTVFTINAKREKKTTVYSQTFKMLSKIKQDRHMMINNSNSKSKHWG